MRLSPPPAAAHSALLLLGPPVFGLLMPVLLARPARADSVQLFGPGLPNSTCGLEFGSPPTQCQTTFALQVEALARAASGPLPDDAPCAAALPQVSERKRLASALLQAAHARPAATGAGIAAALVGPLADSVGAEAKRPVRDAVGRNFESEPKRATCGLLMAVLPAEATLVGFDYTETARDGTTGSCFKEAGCINGDAAFDGAPETLVREAGGQVMAAAFRNWSTSDRIGRMLLYFTLPPHTLVQLAR